MADTDWRGSHGNGYNNHSSSLYQTNGGHVKVPQVYTDSIGYSNGVRSSNGGRLGRRSERGGVNPKQFAPIRPIGILPTSEFKDGTSPQTPPVRFLHYDNNHHVHVVVSVLVYDVIAFVDVRSLFWE